MLEAAYDRFATLTDDDREGLGPAARRYVDAKLVELGAVETFLAEQSLVLDHETRRLFLNALEDELPMAFQLLHRRAGGDFSPDTRMTRFAQPSTMAANRNRKLAGFNAWQAFEAWVKERQPAPATVDRWRGVLLSFNEYFQGRDVATITEEEAVTWKATLVTPNRTATSANDVWLRAVKVVFGWLVENKKLTVNPFKGLNVARRKKAKRREKAFEDEEWQAILRAALAPPPKRMKGKKAAARRWVPWLCAYTGSRPGEMTQLQGSSIKQYRGIWIIDISPEDGAVKGGSYRRVPIHEHLIEQGFLDFVKRSGEGPLFYDTSAARQSSTDPTKPKRPPYVIARNKLAEWVRTEVGIDDPDISPNHAWRHTFKRKAARHGFEKRFRAAFCGHETDEVGDIYETPTIEDMAKELKKFPRYVLDQPKVKGYAEGQTSDEAA
jgi:integrase